MKSLLCFKLWVQHFINIYSGIVVCDITVVLCGCFTLVWRNTDESFNSISFSFLYLNLKTAKQTTFSKNGIQNLPFLATSWNTQMLWQSSVLWWNLSAVSEKAFPWSQYRNMFLQLSNKLNFFKGAFIFPYYFNYKIGDVTS